MISYICILKWTRNSIPYFIVLFEADKHGLYDGWKWQMQCSLLTQKPMHLKVFSTFPLSLSAHLPPPVLIAHYIRNRTTLLHLNTTKLILLTLLTIIVFSKLRSCFYAAAAAAAYRSRHWFCLAWKLRYQCQFYYIILLSSLCTFGHNFRFDNNCHR